MKTEIKKTAKKISGKIVSDKMDKTRVVEITQKMAHPMYQKIYLASRRVKAHDAKNEYHLGEIVEISETRPFSKAKVWEIVGKIVSGAK